MECNEGTHGEDCEKPRVKQECSNQYEISESQTTHIQQFDTHVMKCVQSSDVDTKAGITEETWNANIPSSGFKSNPNQPATCQDTDTIKADDEISIKQERIIQHEISSETQIPHLQPNKTYLMAHDESSDLDTKLVIKQEAWDPNRVSRDLKFNPEQSSSSDIASSLGTGTLKADDEIVIKQEHSWFEGTSADSLNEEEGSDSRNCKAAEDVSLLGTSRSYTDPVLDTCKKTVSKLHFNEHVLVHDNKRQYTCQFCEKNFKQLSVLKLHLLVHSDKRQYKCQICNKSFKQLSVLKSHRLVHVDKRKHNCQICEKSFKRIGDFKSHLLVHDEKRQYKCHVCDKSFKWLRCLKTHLLLHDDKRRYKCQICEKGFKRLSHLNSHMLVHDSKRQFKCEICSKEFKRLDILKLHLVVHDDKRQYKCHICEKSFKQSCVLKRHLLVHDNNRQYKCQVCKKNFKWLRTLKTHLLVHDDNR